MISCAKTLPLRLDWQAVRRLYLLRYGKAMGEKRPDMVKLADAIGMHYASLCRIRQGKSLPNHRNLASLCRVLGCQPGEILFLPGNMQKTRWIYSRGENGKPRYRLAAAS